MYYYGSVCGLKLSSESILILFFLLFINRISLQILQTSFQTTKLNKIKKNTIKRIFRRFNIDFRKGKVKRHKLVNKITQTSQRTTDLDHFF